VLEDLKATVRQIREAEARLRRLLERERSRNDDPYNRDPNYYYREDGEPYASRWREEECPWCNYPR